jgi:hypothetical protein
MEETTVQVVSSCDASNIYSGVPVSNISWYKTVQGEVLHNFPQFLQVNFVMLPSDKPIPVTVQSKAWVYGRLFAEIARSNSAESMIFRLFCLLCVV